MPFILKTKISEHALMGIWQITEPEESLGKLIALSPGDEERLAEIRHPLRRNQWLACRVIAAGLKGTPDVNLGHTEHGAPFFTDGSFHVSFSHSGNYAAAILSTENRVGIDIELTGERIFRVAERFMTKEELERATEPNRLEKLYVYWTVKEALYKLYHDEQPDIHRGIVLEPFDYLCSGSGIVRAVVVCGETRDTHRLRWMRTKDFMLAYTLEPL